MAPTEISAYAIPGIRIDYTPELIVSATAKAFGKEAHIIYSKTNRREITEPRMVAMFLIRSWLGYSLAKTGFVFKKDHSTVIHSVNTISGLLKVDKEIRRKFIQIAHELHINSDVINHLIAMK